MIKCPHGNKNCMFKYKYEYKYKYQVGYASEAITISITNCRRLKFLQSVIMKTYGC